MSGAVVALSADPTSPLFNPASIYAMSQMGSDMSYGTTTGASTDRLLLAYANPASEEGARVATGVYLEGQLRPAPWKYYVPYLSSIYTPLPRLAVGATLRMINELPRNNDSLDAKWSNSIDVGFLTAGKNLNFGANFTNAFGGTSVVSKSTQWGIAIKSDNNKMNISYQWDGDLISGIKYSYVASHLGVEYILGSYGMIRGGYEWSDIHRISVGGAVGLIEGGSLVQFGWSFPTEGKLPTQWALGFSYRI
jgi:hypothetical protein